MWRTSGPAARPGTPTKKRYEIVHVTSVAESYNDVPNDTFTNVPRKKLEHRRHGRGARRRAARPALAEVAAKLYIRFLGTEPASFWISMPACRGEPLEGAP